MRSATSFFNGTLLKKNWKRFWPIWALYFVILLFTMPVNLLLSYSSYSRSAVGMELSERMAREAAQHVTGGNTVGLELIVVFALLTAMAVWSYLYAARSAGGIHSLPVRREGLFLTNFVSGLSFLILPQVVIYVLMIICTAATGCLDLGALTMWLVRVCAYALIFFSGATFCALCTGHILALPAFYVIANVLVIALTYLVEGVLSAFVFGYRSVYSFEWAAIWLTPVYKLLNDCGAKIRYEELADGSYGKVLGVVWSGNGVVAVYVVLAVVLAVLALVIYRRRHLERAGDVVAVGWMRPVFRYGVATCCGLTFGSFFYEMFYGVVERGAWGLLLFMVIFAVIGYFLASMLLAKSFRVFRRWKGCVGLVVVFLALTCVMEFDLFGFEKKVPDLDSVVSVEVNGPETYPWDQASYGSCTITDREAIELILTAHEDIVRRKGEVESLLSEGSYLGYYAAASSFRVTYELKSGARMTRSYEIPLREEDLALEGTYAASLEEFVNLPEVIYEAYELDVATPERASYMDLELYNRKTGEHEWMEVTDTRTLAAIWEAVRRDIAAGNLCRRSILGTYDGDEVLTTGLRVEFRVPSESSGDVTLQQGEGEVKLTAHQSVRVALRTTAVHTLQALRDAGLLDETYTLMTENGTLLSWDTLSTMGTL